jgi:hypothetical protein
VRTIDDESDTESATSQSEGPEPSQPMTKEVTEKENAAPPDLAGAMGGLSVDIGQET